MPPKADINKQGWEQADFPIVCETCLGNNPYMRMTKEGYGKECKVCTRPFTVFRWNPGSGMRFKKTEICQTCAKVKNVCQTCLLDLEYGLPVQVRDQILKINDAIPVGQINKEYFTQNQEAKLGSTDTYSDYSKAPSAAHEVLKRLARSGPYYKRNRAQLCSFFAKGTCTRGDECPFRHEMPDEDASLADQNIKDRFHGTNDPVARKMLQHLANPTAKPLPPSDTTIKTLFVSNLADSVTEGDLRTQFYSYGEITGVVLVSSRKCAFVTFATRDSAEEAIDRTAGGLSINGASVRVQWGKPAQQGPKTESLPESGAAPLAPSMAAPFPVPGIGMPMFFPPPPPPPGAANVVYPSQDPRQLGASPAGSSKNP